MDRLLDRFRIEENRRILIIGDCMLDRYEYGRVGRISPEAPVPVFTAERSGAVPGGAANVAVNAAALGVQVSLMSVVGTDEDGDTLLALLGQRGVDTGLVLRDPARPTTRKTRLIAQHNQQVLRMDRETSLEISAGQQEGLLEQLKLRLDGVDLALVSDYLKGFLPKDFLQAVLALCREKGVRAAVDIKSHDPARYRGAYLLKPNLSELCRAMGAPIAKTDEAAIALAHGLKERTQAEAVLVTRGSLGMLLAGPGEETVSLPSLAREVYDVTGAGDTVLAGLGACLASGMCLGDAVEIANVAAGVKVGKVGTCAVSAGEIRSALLARERGHSPVGKTLERERFLAEILPGLQAAGKRLVFTNGCFDVLHVGHLRYLNKAAALGDVLIVGLNSDDSVRRLKGPTRPINSLADRAELLGQLDCVDYIVPFDTDTPLTLITAIQPDVLVKGGDYTVESIAGSREVLAVGGRVETIPLVAGKSTTAVLERLKQP